VSAYLEKFKKGMSKEYSKEEWWKLYERLPDELKEAIFSVENAKAMSEICKRHEILDKSSEITKYVGRVLLGVLPPEEFREYLEQGLGKEKAKRISHDINRFVFFPVKQSLAELYKMEVIPTVPKPKAPPKKEDVYREPLE
jgi:oligoribonuclease NrnB/cAMP/cGMP phosphodiesterase (DHH superfamily)